MARKLSMLDGAFGSSSSGGGSSITAAIGEDTFTTWNTNFDFNEDDLYVAVKGVGDISLQLNDAPTGVEYDWEIYRNPDDVFDTDLPDLTVNPDDSTQATLGSWAEGSFNIAVYQVDESDSTRERRARAGRSKEAHAATGLIVVLNAALIKFEMDTENSYLATGGAFESHPLSGDPTQTAFWSGNSNAYIFEADALFTAWGGGSDGSLGLNNGQIVIGWIQNLTSNVITCYYADTSETEYYCYSSPSAPPPPPPPYILDADANAGTGGSTAFADSVITPSPATGGGYNYEAYTNDIPHYTFHNVYPGTSHHATEAAANYQFKLWVCAYSVQSPGSYVALGLASWGMVMDFDYDSGNNEWYVSDETGAYCSSVIDQTGCPNNLAALDSNAVATGPTANALGNRVPPLDS